MIIFLDINLHNGQLLQCQNFCNLISIICGCGENVDGCLHLHLKDRFCDFTLTNYFFADGFKFICKFEVICKY